MLKHLCCFRVENWIQGNLHHLGGKLDSRKVTLFSKRMDAILHEDLATVENVSPFLKQCVGKGKEIPIGSFLQVQQIVNISFPTYDKPNYDSERHTLKLTVTDGHSQGYAIISDSCPGISLNTPPGTKIKTTQPIAVHGSLFVLTRNNCEVFGGRVAKLFEKWEIQKKMAFKHEWGYTGSAVEGEGPPPWKPFGYKPSIDVAALRKMRAMDVVNEKKDGQTTGSKTQFDVQRDEAISELQATANKQKFQKPNKHLLDKEITDIMDEGFTQDEAEYSMKRFKNPQKALKFLKDSKKRQDGLPVETPKPAIERKDRRKKGKGMEDDEEQEVPAEYQRPTRNISLFGFLEGQIKLGSKKPSQPQANGPTSQNQVERNRELETNMGRMDIRESQTESYNMSGRNDRGRGRAGGGYRGGGYRGEAQTGGGSGRDSYQRFENKVGRTEATDKPPRFQNRGGSDGRSSDYYHGPPQKSQPTSGYDSYRGQNQDSYNSSAKEHPQTYSDNSFQNRQNYTPNYQSQTRLPSGKDSYSYKDRGQYSSEYHPPPQYAQTTEYPVPSQNYHSYQQQSVSRQYGDSYRGGGQTRSQSHYSNHSSGNNPPTQPEFSQYQYGYEGWNPAQSLVFTRSKPEGSRGGRGGGHQGNGRSSSSYNAGPGRSQQMNRY